MNIRVIRRVLGSLIVICLAAIVITTFNESEAAIRSKSVWHHTNAKTISSRDVMGNNISVVCAYGHLDIYLSTKLAISRNGYRTHARLWANKDNKVNTRAHYISEKQMRIRISDYAAYHALLSDLKNKYDLSIYLRGNRQNDIILFALDGFSSKIRRVCGL